MTVLCTHGGLLRGGEKYKTVCSWNTDNLFFFCSTVLTRLFLFLSYGDYIDRWWSKVTLSQSALPARTEEHRRQDPKLIFWWPAFRQLEGKVVKQVRGRLFFWTVSNLQIGRELVSRFAYALLRTKNAHVGMRLRVGGGRTRKHTQASKQVNKQTDVRVI